MFLRRAVPNEGKRIEQRLARFRRAQTRSQIAQSALSEDGDCFDRTVDSHISRIRKKLGPNAGGLIKTIWGIGYRFDLEEI